jgi:hypothetical protein
MKTTILWRLFVAAIVVLPVATFAQEGEKPVQGYIFGSTGRGFGAGMKIGAGFGVERVFTPGIGVGGELQGFGLMSDGSSAGGVILGLNGSYRIPLPQRRWVPFITGGYSGLAACSYGCGGLSGFNYGAGVNYWMKSNRGLRLEVRDHVFQDYRPLHMPEFRIGFSF